MTFSSNGIDGSTGSYLVPTLDAAESCGTPTHRRPRLRMYGPDAVGKARAKTAKKGRRAARSTPK